MLGPYYIYCSEIIFNVSVILYSIIFANDVSLFVSGNEETEVNNASNVEM